MSNQPSPQKPCQPAWPKEIAALLRELKIVIREAILREQQAKEAR